MSAPSDAASAAELATTLGLLDRETGRACLIELGDKKSPAEQLVRLMERKRLLTPFQGSKLLKGETDGYFLGGYRLLYKIASGSFGRVYRGDDPRTGQIVAIKVLRKRWTEDAKRIESFEREGRLGLTMEHPNIVRILAVSKDGPTGQHYMVMEFVEGGNLRDILAIRKKMEPLEAVRIMEECAAGLAYAHSRGLSHRDIKSSNILLGTDKVAKLVDFGLAGIHEGMHSTFAAAKPGDKDESEGEERTVDYAGLEKATGVKSGDVRSDIYFLGHVLYEMLSGSPLMPPTRDKNARMARRRFEDAETALIQGAAAVGIPANLTRLIAKAISLDPKHRFQTPTAFHEALRTAHRELDGGHADASHGPASAKTPAHPQPGLPETHSTLFIVESNTKLQDAFREKFKKLGFRVLMTLDAEQAIRRYQQQAYQALIVDAGSVAQDGVEAYRRVLVEAKAKKEKLAAVLILNEDQAGWGKAVENLAGGRILIRPVKMRDVLEALGENLPELQDYDHHGEE